MTDKIDKRTLWISIGNDCNLRCGYCCYEMRAIEMAPVHEYLSFIHKALKYIYNELKLKPKLEICGWGEAFFYPWFVDFLNSLDQNILESINITTNGTYPEQIQSIMDTQKMSFTVSLDAPMDFHDKNRGIGNFQKTVDFIQNLKEKGVKNIIINNLIVKSNFQKILEILSFYEGNLKIKEIRFKVLSNYFDSYRYMRNNYNPSQELLSESDILYLIENFNQYFKKEDFLPTRQDISQYPLYLSLFSDGTISNCCEGSVKIAHFQEPIEKIFQKLEKSSHCGICKEI